MIIKKLNIGQKMFLGFGIVILIMLAVIGNSYVNFTKESEAVQWNVHTYEIIQASNDVLMNLINMETGARGYVLTGNESFLEPFNQGKTSYEQYYNKLKKLTADNFEQQQRLINVEKEYESWLEWQKTKVIAGRQKVSLGESKLEDIIAVIQIGEGKAMMDNLRSILGDINKEEERLLQNKNIDLIKMEKETRAIMLSGGALATIAAIIIASLVVRMVVNPVKIVTNTFKEISEGDVDLEVRLKANSNDELGNMAKHFNIFMSKLKELISENKNHSWITSGRAELNEAIRGEENVDLLSSKAISYICKYLDAQIGAIYIRTDDNTFKLIGSYAYNTSKNSSNEIKIGEGIIGQSVLEKKTILMTDIPENYIKVVSGTGEAVPKNILVTPCMYLNEVECIMEIGSFNEITDVQLKYIEQISATMAISISAAKAQLKMKELLDKTLVQAEELQVQQEELRQNNEELEEQTKILIKSEMNLQAQQEELRVSNEELEEQTRKLELQKKDITDSNKRLIKAKFEIEEKAKELENTNKYKSEFLANMSHELRTPLNSILVLSELLKNKKDNTPLTDKQLEYAKTIHLSGENLLKLINDILDLSKVEAGKMDVNLETINLEELAKDIKLLFNPIALQNKLYFNIEIEEGLPKEIVSDSLRLQQIINNLLSNAFKFTHNGGVTMNICRPKVSDISSFDIKGDIEKLISIEISDTGIGIPLDKQELIFEAFKQSDGTTSRKYGGTGLGLSISKELAHLLGGDIYLKSREKEGSTFTLIILDKANADVETLELAEKNEQSSNNINSEELYNSYDDTEDNISKKLKRLLIVDESKEQTYILYESFSKKGFKVTTLQSGLDAYNLFKTEQFDCMILDLNFKDISGLELLKKLKYENTIKFPILIHTEKSITWEDEAELNKYVEGIIIKGNQSVERLIDEVSLLFHKVDSKIENENITIIKSNNERENSLINKKILIVDDDMRNVFALTSLLEEKGIKVVVGRNGAEGIQKLHENSDVDLIIMDVMMPKMDGYTAMKEIRKEKQFSHLPIIAITAKAMKDDRQRCIEAGANDYLTKPIEINKLISLLRVWLYK